jgi:hypothetical protein
MHHRHHIKLLTTIRLLVCFRILHAHTNERMNELKWAMWRVKVIKFASYLHTMIDLIKCFYYKVIIMTLLDHVSLHTLTFIFKLIFFFLLLPIILLHTTSHLNNIIFSLSRDCSTKYVTWHFNYDIGFIFIHNQRHVTLPLVYHM